MSHIDSLPPLRDVIAEYGLAAKKALGQNFLLDLNITMKIAQTAGAAGRNNGIGNWPRSGWADQSIAGKRCKKGGGDRAGRKMS